VLSEAASELYSSRRCTSRTLRKRNALNGLTGWPFRASKAHRLPKSVAYVSAWPRQVKQKWLKTRAFGAFGNRIP